jgi:hypothetical protein
MRVLLLMILAQPCFGQCSMCFRTAAAQQAWQAQALNLGIVALLIPPVFIIAAILIAAFRRVAGADRERRAAASYTSCE